MVRGTRSQQPVLVAPFTPSAERVSKPPKKPRRPTVRAQETAQLLKERQIRRDKEKLQEEARHNRRGSTILAPLRVGAYETSTPGSWIGKVRPPTVYGPRKRGRQGSGVLKSPNSVRMRLNVAVSWSVVL